ncbi:DegT/DnrJ/EryC1/StrS family aminotransferase [Flavobacterium sp.]
MFIVNPDPFLLPTYRMSPFTTAAITENNHLPNNEFANNYFDKRFGNANWKFTSNGRQGIEEALKTYKLSSSDVVTVLTTSQNLYISSCVTKTIEKFCQWNRKITSETKVILVNHEFGFPYQDMESLLKLNIPIIEDCCTTFFSQDKENKIGHYGDFSVYSFPKMFPIQVGGILVSNKIIFDATKLVDSNLKNYLLKVISFHLENKDELLKKRAENYKYASSKFREVGFELRFETNDFIIPYALVLKNNQIVKDLNLLKSFLNENGIQNSVFYGEDAFFIPNHQNLSFTDIDLLHQTVTQFIKNQ